MSNKSSIEQLKVYQLAVRIEGQAFELVKSVSTEQFYPLGNSVRRASSALAHYIAEAHERYSYEVKIQALQYARLAAEELGKLLQEYAVEFKVNTAPLQADATVALKQTWGLMKYLKTKQQERQSKAQAAASDELVAARSS